MLCMCTHLFERANDAKIVRSRDAQCNTEESLKCHCDQKNNSYFSLDFKTMLTKQ